MEISQQIINTLYDLALEAGESGNLATSAILIEKATGKIIFTSQSRVASDKDPLAHADMLVMKRAVTELKEFNLGKYAIVGVFEPSLMALSACYWAGITEYYYFVSADKYLSQIPWASEGKFNKVDVITSFASKLSLTKLDDTEKRFESLCDKYLESIVKK